MSARKMRLVVDNIRGKRVDEALNILRYTKKEAAVWLEKLLLSAIANWQQKAGYENAVEDFDLYIKIIFSNEGQQLKRFRPAPQGRAHRIRKHSNHVTLIVENRVPLEEQFVEDDDADFEEEFDTVDETNDNN